MARVGTDHPNDAFPANNFAILAKLLNGCANFHIQFIYVFTMIRPADKSWGDNSSQTLSPATGTAKLNFALPAPNASSRCPFANSTRYI